MVAGHPYAALYALELATGLLKGELLGLVWYDPRRPELSGVDLDARPIHLREQVQRGELVQLKRGASRRTLALSPWLAASYAGTRRRSTSGRGLQRSGGDQDDRRHLRTPVPAGARGDA